MSKLNIKITGSILNRETKCLISPQRKRLCKIREVKKEPKFYNHDFTNKIL